MEIVILIIMLAIVQYMVFGFQTGMAREKYGVKAPAISGDPTFERYFRVHQNTQEQLMVFIPAILGFSTMATNIGWPGYNIAAGLGVVWLIGRALFARAYVKDPGSRLPGFLLTFIPNVSLVVGTIICVIISVL